MKTNIGSVDRIARILLGATLITLAASGIIGWWGYLGVIALATAAIGWCPPYALLGFSTCAVKK